jgi:hypothetical protein
VHKELLKHTHVTPPISFTPYVDVMTRVVNWTSDASSDQRSKAQSIPMGPRGALRRRRYVLPGQRGNRAPGPPRRRLDRPCASLLPPAVATAPRSAITDASYPSSICLLHCVLARARYAELQRCVHDPFTVLPRTAHQLSIAAGRFARDTARVVLLLDFKLAPTKFVQLISMEQIVASTGLRYHHRPLYRKNGRF